MYGVVDFIFFWNKYSSSLKKWEYTLFKRFLLWHVQWTMGSTLVPLWFVGAYVKH
jgi:hypothetical protein